MNDTVDRFYQATGELMVKAADYDALSARCAELERRLAGAWCVKELEWRTVTVSSQWVEYACDTPFGELEICGHVGEPLQLTWPCMKVAERRANKHDSLDAAKAAAQEWFNEKMTAGLRRVV